MKKHMILFLSFLFVPIISMAADHCTNPKEYTIDKRCYVTDALRKEKPKPYNAVVALLKQNKDGKYSAYCTGTIVEYNGKLYIYTAKHCITKGTDFSRLVLTVRSQDGKIFNVSKNNVGDWYEEKISEEETKEKNFSGDWAIYNMPAKLDADISSVKLSTKTDFGVGPATANYAARVVGHGEMKVMSDKEIADFKQDYIDFLKWGGFHGIKGTEREYGFDGNGGIIADFKINDIFESFLIYQAAVKKSNYLSSLLDRDSLKVSYCSYSSNGKMTGCQIVGGNSGGGIFDVDGNIMGIVTRGNSSIGGKNHAGAQYDAIELLTTNIILLDGILIPNKIKPIEK